MDVKVAILGNRESVLFFLALGIDVFLAEDSAECKEKLLEILKNGFNLIYVTENYANELLGDLDDMQRKYNAVVIFIPGGKESLNLGNKMLESYAEKAIGSKSCLNS